MLTLSYLFESISNKELHSSYLDTFDLKFLKSIDDWKNIGYHPDKYPGYFYTLFYNGEKAGITGVIVLKNQYYFQIAIHKAFRGLGLLNIAANLIATKHNIKKLYATIYGDNVTSLNAHKTAGFVEISKSEAEEKRKDGRLEKGATQLYKEFQ